MDTLKLEEAEDIAIEADVLKRCENHPEEVWETGDDHEGAYKLGNSRFTSRNLRNHYSARRELTDAIQRAIQEAGAFGCTRDCPNAPGGLSVDE